VRKVAEEAAEKVRKVADKEAQAAQDKAAQEAQEAQDACSIRWNTLLKKFEHLAKFNKESWKEFCILNSENFSLEFASVVTRTGLYEDIISPSNVNDNDIITNIITNIINNNVVDTNSKTYGMDTLVSLVYLIESYKIAKNIKADVEMLHLDLQFYPNPNPNPNPTFSENTNTIYNKLWKKTISLCFNQTMMKDLIKT
jgi:hypothetical protein